MSDHNTQNLLNLCYTKIRELEAKVADIEARLERRGIAPTLDEREQITNG